MNNIVREYKDCNLVAIYGGSRMIHAKNCRIGFKNDGKIYKIGVKIPGPLIINDVYETPVEYTYQLICDLDENDFYVAVSATSENSGVIYDTEYQEISEEAYDYFVDIVGCCIRKNEALVKYLKILKSISRKYDKYLLRDAFEELFELIELENKNNSRAGFKLLDNNVTNRKKNPGETEFSVVSGGAIEVYTLTKSRNSDYRKKRCSI